MCLPRNQENNINTYLKILLYPKLKKVNLDYLHLTQQDHLIKYEYSLNKTLIYLKQLKRKIHQLCMETNRPNHP